MNIKEQANTATANILSQIVTNMVGIAEANALGERGPVGEMEKSKEIKRLWGELKGEISLSPELKTLKYYESGFKQAKLNLKRGRVTHATVDRAKQQIVNALDPLFEKIKKE